MKTENSMAYRYRLRELACAENWAGLREALAENRGLGPGRHDVLAAAFLFAARGGQADILATMHAQGFAQASTEAEEMLETLGRHHLPQAAPAIVYLVNDRRISPERMLNVMAVRGDAAGLERLDASGIDTFASSSVFFLAFFEAKEDTMEFLYKKGAALYHPANIKGLYARKSEPGEAGLEAFAKLVAADADAGAAALEGLARPPAATAEARETCFDERNRKTTVLHLLARAGGFSAATAFSLAEAEKRSPAPLTAQDILRKDAQGQTVLSILAARREVPLVLNPALWRRRPEEAVKIIDALRELGAGEAVDVKAFAAALRTASSTRRRDVFAP